MLPEDPNAGLLPGLQALAGPRFDAGAVDPLIDDFYARTAAFDLKISSRWSGWIKAIICSTGRPCTVNVSISAIDQPIRAAAN